MELKKLMEHISIIPDYRQAWKVEHKLPDILSVNYLRRYFWCIMLGRYRGFGETHLDFLKQYGDFEMVFLFTISLPELYLVSVLQNFMSALLTGCVTAIPQMIKMSLQLMEKRFGTLMTRVAARERFMSLKSVFILFAMSLMNLLISRLNGKG
ncbi:hypothetical protein T638_00045 [Escherichia coli MRSN 10204]|nr:hypothetical protein T638_00045 [Escherichia coli MRSN 10204]